MPGELPDSSAYTYAVEFSVDEAVEAGATDVKFTKPVTTYVDNFLGFKAGTIVPSAYYDEGKGAWVPSKNGLVIKLVSESNGRANVDTDGDGTADNAGLDDAERSKLAQQYDAGKSLWRVEVEHFTPWDYNWPYGCRAQCDAPDEEPPPPAVLPRVPGRRLDHRRLQPDAGREAVRPRHPVRPLLQLGPRARLQGGLPGRRSRSPAPSIRPSLRRVELEVTVAGREFRQTFAAAGQPEAHASSGTARTPTAARSTAPRTPRSGSATSTRPSTSSPPSSRPASASSAAPPVTRNETGATEESRREIIAWQEWERPVGDARRRRGRARRLDARRPPRLRPAVAHAVPRRRLAGHDRGDPLARSAPRSASPTAASGPEPGPPRLFPLETRPRHRRRRRRLDLRRRDRAPTAC